MCVLRAVLLISIAAAAIFGATIPGGGFDDVSSIPGLDWNFVNNSSPGGTTSWFQGNSGVFPAQSGAANSYVAANFLAADFGGDISLWLITPVLSLTPGGTVSFYTRTEAGSLAPDRLEVRMSVNGASIDVGGTSASTGDFSTSLGSVNPTLALGLYPETWTQFTFALPVIADTNGRIGFRYFVPDTSVNGNYIGIDSVSVDAVVPEPATSTVMILAGAALCAIRLRRRA